jgi:hypothetical protein
MSALNLTDKEKTNSGANLQVHTGRLDDTQLLENLNQYLGQENSNKILVQLSPKSDERHTRRELPKLSVSNPLPFGKIETFK